MNLVRELEGYEGVYLDGPRAAVVIADDRSRARAAARLTVLGGVDVNIVSSSSACRRGTLVSLSDDARRAAWTPLRLDVDTNVRTAHGKSVLVVSSAPASHAAVLRAQASGPLTTYGTSHASQVMDMLAVCALPHVIVLDGDLEGTDGVDERIRALYPSRFGAFGRVQWMSGKKGLSDDDVERILEAVGMRPHPTLARDEPFSHVRVLVVGDFALAQEVSLAAPGAEVTRVSGWQAIDRLAEGDVELIVAGDVEDVGAASLVRFARRCEVTPSILIANDAPKSTRMRKAYPQVAHYFVDRPIRGEDLTRVLSPVR